jgi:two-component system, OmpR family, KDP operon response regulator KdpE
MLRASVTESEDPQVEPASAHRILVVDDDRSLCRALSISLRAHGYEVDVACDGVQALDSVSCCEPDLVLLDLDLPGIAGISVIAALRALGSIPIVVFSARDECTARSEVIEAGADDYATKPVDIEVLLTLIQSASRRSEVSRANCP